ncbi:MAG: hypothetical protein IPG38_12015 [Chitinophagaceae bacterium]|nr:hypothetical protein [Chitinophagaceae bacterium]
MHLTAKDLVNDFEKLCYHQEEPFQSSGIFAQYKIFELAKQRGVKVLLDGQGADELLAGYPKYIHWYLQEVLSRHKLGATQKERVAFRKNNQPFHWDLKIILLHFFHRMLPCNWKRSNTGKPFSHPDISDDFLPDETPGMVGIHKPIVTKLNDIPAFSYN